MTELKPLNWEWPLTHSERIAELQEALKDESFLLHKDNIQAAIAYHKELDPNALCDPKFVHFQNGQEVEEPDSGCLSYWAEVGNSPAL
jgi:hypothetical protein